MDNITHTLFGATLARTPLGRAGRGTTAALLLASNAPDIDIVATAGGAMKYLEWHRGPTHGPLGVLLLGLATAALVAGGRRLADQRPRKLRPGLGSTQEGSSVESVQPGSRDASFRNLAVVSIFGVLCHVLMDVPTSYGTRFLSPFDWHWHAFDWMPIIDVYLLGVLAAGLVFARSASARRKAPLIVLMFMAANYGLRAATHARALEVAPRIFGARLPDRCNGTSFSRGLDRWPRPAARLEHGPCLIELAATPGFATPFEWRLIAQLSNGYYVQSVNLLDSDEGNGDAVRGLVPNTWTPMVVRAASTRPAQVFLGFSRFPAVRVAVDHQGFGTAIWNDIRFSGGPSPPRPQNDGRGDLFGATVRLAPDGTIIEARLGGR